MIKRTYSEVKKELSRIAGQTGLRIEDPRLLDFVNVAQERLVTEGEWPFMYARLKFCQYEGLVSLPSEYEAIVRCDIDRSHAVIFDPWYEFVHYGPGQQDSWASVSVAIDRGESPVYRQPCPDPLYVRVHATTDERVNGVRPLVRIFGYDVAGQWIRSQDNGVWHDGIDLELRGDVSPSYATSTIKFKKVTQVSKPVTKGPVTLVYVDDGGLEYNAGNYRHRETSPSFRTYHLPGIRANSTKMVHAIVRRRFRPILEDQDDMLVTSVPALRLAVMAVSFEDKGDLTNAEGYWTKAKQVLSNESALYKGPAKPPIEVSPVAVFGGPEISDFY